MLTNFSSMVLQLSTADSVKIATAAIAVLVGSAILRFIWNSRQYDNLPKPPASSFLFGHIGDTWGNVATWNTKGDYPEPFLSWVKQYGSAVYYREFFDHVVMITDPVALQDMLHSNGTNYPRQAVMRGYFRDVLLGDGLLSVDGKLHDAYRKIMNPLFTVSKIKAFVDIFDKQTQQYCEKSTFLKVRLPSLTPISLKCSVHEILMLSIIGLTVLGLDFDSSPEALEAYENCMIEMSPAMLIGVFTIPGFFSFPIPSLMKRRKAQATLKKILQDIIHQKLAAPASDNPKDLLDMILPHSTTQEVLGHTLTFVLAGHDTSSNTLGFVFGTLFDYPDAVAGIRAEYNKVISKYGSLKSWEAVSELVYTQAVIQETLRLNAVVFMTMLRTSQDNDTIPMSDGSTVFIPKGTNINLNMAAMHRNPKYWKDPDSFIPARFIEGSAEWGADLDLRGGKPHAFHFMPFSAGSKNCIGQRFAIAELQVIVATMVSKFDFAPSANMDMRHEYGGITVRPVKVEMTVRRAKAPSA
ncbi:hypothetical protein AeMF1_014301 [Aphanomyces euteiches]|nr:hypothetical protein AeMF1_014301 [Aphanomyces euteiches]KAH9189469.1 hypothetical protein AeNC1_008555 [Aphanomyces euteiches]